MKKLHEVLEEKIKNAEKLPKQRTADAYTQAEVDAIAEAIDVDLSVKADKTNVLQLNNTTAFTPDADYEPATKKYVDDNGGGVEADPVFTAWDKDYADLTNTPDLSNLHAPGSDNQVLPVNSDFTLNGLSEKSFNNLTDKPTIPVVSDTAYDATSWDANTDAPTKNVIRDKFESLSFAAPLGLDDNYVTDAEKTVIGNTSGTNSGDNATNSLYSGLAVSKQDADTQLTSLAALAFAGNSLKVIRVNSGETDFELSTPSSGSGEVPTNWGKYY